MDSEYIEQRDGGYYVAGTRISLDSVVYSFREGQSPEAIQEDFPLLKRSQIYGGDCPFTWTMRRRSTITSKKLSVNSRAVEFLCLWPNRCFGRRSSGPERAQASPVVEYSLSGRITT